jgi:hypothetical protein
MAKDIHYEPVPPEFRLIIMAAWPRGGLPQAAIELLIPAGLQEEALRLSRFGFLQRLSQGHSMLVLIEEPVAVATVTCSRRDGPPLVGIVPLPKKT